MAPRLALRALDPDDPELGRAGELLVERSLRARGWRFLARRLETRWGELDLVMLERNGARDGPGCQTLVVLEVKTGRIGPRFRPGMRFQRQALTRRWHAARALAGERPGRVDLVEVLLEARDRIRLEHHRGIRIPL